jgi:hypothetical protein
VFFIFIVAKADKRLLLGAFGSEEKNRHSFGILNAFFLFILLHQKLK